jgi:hypothetical protein
MCPKLEHVGGEYDERHALRLMYDALTPGGSLIATVPIDRKSRIEYRDRDYYGTQSAQSESRYFFQRIYDKASIWERLLLPLRQEPTIVRWFGETQRGRLTEYATRWVREDHNCTVDDRRDIADHFRQFSSWEEMSSMGVYGIMIEKASSGNQLGSPASPKFRKRESV